MEFVRHTSKQDRRPWGHPVRTQADPLVASHRRTTRGHRRYAARQDHAGSLEPAFLLAGALLTVIGVMLPNAVAVLSGVPLLFFALLKGLTARDNSGRCSYRSYLAPPL